MTDKMPILCLDFDGVLHSYTSGWKGAGVVPDAPTEGMVEFLDAAIERFDVQVFSSRSSDPAGIPAMREWLHDCIMAHFDCAFHTPPECERAYEIYNALKFPTTKPAAFLTIDDRALCFTGNWSDFHPSKLREFQPWNKRSPSNGMTQGANQNALRTLASRMGSTLTALFRDNHSV